MLIEAVDPQPGQKILSGMDGYGSVSRWILDSAKSKGFTPEIFSLDESPVQVERLRKSSLGIPPDHVAIGDIRETPFEDDTFDTVVIKMGVHELPKDEQPNIFKEVLRILKPGGRFVIWELSLNEKNQRPFQDIIREKDRLAGFDELVRNRYFPTHSELLSLFESTGYTSVTAYYSFTYRPSTLDRKDELVSKERKQILDAGTISDEQQAELDALGRKRAVELACYARSRITPDLHEEMNFSDYGDDVQFRVEKVITIGRKPA